MSFEINNYGNLVWSNEKGEWHRKNGPAFIAIDGRIQYRLNGNIHRVDGPALIYPDGSKDYWIHGNTYTKEKYYTKVKKL